MVGVGVDGWSRGWVAVVLRDGRYDSAALFDHIGGVLTCLAEADEIPGLDIADVWFNGYVHLTGGKVTSTEGNQGRIFHSYVNRRLDVLVDPRGNVISLGLY